MPENHHDDDKTRSFVALTKGTQVGQYKIISKIGAGGMGEVYLAQDSQLDRKVALKFLPQHLCQDEDCRARFTREAKAAAKLDHPNIVPVYEVGEFQGRPYFAMAHIEGQSLRDLIKDGRLGINEAIDLTMQILKGLHKAHESGVVHRDIKPGNIIIDNDGRARLVDFGLAMVTGEDKLTKTGSTLGTVGYMSPEQIEGTKIDHRSDIFSVGVILYEMLTGRRPFEGDNEVAISRSITDAIPEPISRYSSGVTDALQQVIDRALAKDPGMRYQHADDLGSDLKRIRAGYQPTRTRRRGRLLAVISLGAILAVAAVGYFFGDWFTHEPEYRLTRKQITFDGDIYQSELSPDGNYVAYIRGEFRKSQMADSMQVFVKDLKGGDPIEIMKDWWITRIKWTPDGEKLLIRADNDSVGGFYLLPKLGGAAQRFELYRESHWWNMSWAANGTRFATYMDKKRNHIWIINILNGQVDTLVMECDIDYIYDVSWSPVSETLLVRTLKGTTFQLWTLSVDGKLLNEIRFEGGESPRWSEDGHFIIYQQSDWYSQNIVEQQYDSGKNQLVGEPKVLFSGLEGSAEFDLIRDQGRILYTKVARWDNLWLAELDITGNPSKVRIAPLTDGTARIVGVNFSPDGDHVAFSMVIDSYRQVFVQNLSTGERAQLTHTGSFNYGACWSPDGKKIAYGTRKGNHVNLAVMPARGGVPTIFDSCFVAAAWAEWHPIVWAPADEIIYRIPGHSRYIAFDPEIRVRRPLGPTYNLGEYWSPVYSPQQDRFVATISVMDTLRDYESGKARRSGLWFFSTNDTTAAPFWSDAKLFPVGWSDDGDSLFIWHSHENRLVRVSIDDHGADTLAYLPGAFIDVALSPDHSKFAYTISEQTSDIWLVEKVYID
jgi:serine/threonine protein kinase